MSLMPLKEEAGSLRVLGPRRPLPALSENLTAAASLSVRPGFDAAAELEGVGEAVGGRRREAGRPAGGGWIAFGGVTWTRVSAVLQSTSVGCES